MKEKTLIAVLCFVFLLGIICIIAIMSYKEQRIKILPVGIKKITNEIDTDKLSDEYVFSEKEFSIFERCFICPPDNPPIISLPTNGTKPNFPGLRLDIGERYYEWQWDGTKFIKHKIWIWCGNDWITEIWE